MDEREKHNNKNLKIYNLLKIKKKNKKIVYTRARIKLNYYKLNNCIYSNSKEFQKNKVNEKQQK